MTAPARVPDAQIPPTPHHAPTLTEIAAHAQNQRRVALYARVSTTKQDPTPQLTRLRQWARDRGYSVSLERIDIATGKNMIRPGWADIVRAARGHEVHAVAVVKVDRAARSVLDLAKTVQDFHDKRVDFYAVDQGIEVSRGSPTSELVLNIFSAVAQWEGQIISERTRDSLDARRADGQKLGPSFAPCSDCGGPRHAEIRGKRAGRRVPLCPTCKQGGPANGVPNARRENTPTRGGPVDGR